MVFEPKNKDLRAVKNHLCKNQKSQPLKAL
jgi:hypothetical protein